jgi:hypothetical protein
LGTAFFVRQFPFSQQKLIGAFNSYPEKTLHLPFNAWLDAIAIWVKSGGWNKT